MPNVNQTESATKELLLDILHLVWTFAASGYRVPSDIMLDRKAYERMCIAQERKRVRRLVQRLKEQRLATIRERGDRVCVALTRAGKIAGLRLHIILIEQDLPRGECCLVSFDVPEYTRDARRNLRNFLRDASFERVHHSLWKSTKDVAAPMRELIRIMDAQDWISVFCVKE